VENSWRTISSKLPKPISIETYTVYGDSIIFCCGYNIYSASNSSSIKLLHPHYKKNLWKDFSQPFTVKLFIYLLRHLKPKKNLQREAI